MDAVFDAAVRDPSVYGARDAAIIALLCGSGLPELDLNALQVEHFDPGAAQLCLPRDSRTLVVRLTPIALGALERWLSFRGPSPAR
jgi:integrase